MSKKLPSEELSWEEAVARYLEDHPDYFERHTDVLARLEVPHADKGKAVSLIERQVEVLRERNTALHQQLRELVAIARDNDTLSERLHRFAGAMVDASSLDDALDTAQDMLRHEFKLDAAVVLLSNGPVASAGRPEFVGGRDPRFNALATKFAERRPICGNQLDRDTLGFLFGSAGTEIRSTALVPLRNATHRGLLGLGSRDTVRFHPEMGTVYLVRIGELLMRSVARYLP